MRKIIFRGKRIDNGEWVVGWLIGCPKESPDNGKLKRAWIILKIADFACHCFADAKARFHEVQPETVGQFTGLLDKNGKKIFEGDCLLEGGDELIVTFGVPRETQFTGNASPRFYCILDDGSLWDFEPSDDITVIGNIHDQTNEDK